MASTYGNDLRLEEIGDGEQSGTWGATTNTNLELISEALSFGTEGITTNADTHTTTIADGASDPGRSLYLKYTGTLDSACTITIAPNSISKTWYIENGTSGSQSIIISQGSGANVTIKTGQTKIVYSDGAGSSAAMAEIGTLGVANLAVDTNATVGGNATITGNIDVDGVTNLDAVDIDGAVQLDSTLTVGANDQGYDVILYGDTAARNATWDSSADSLIFTDNTKAVFGTGSDASILFDGTDMKVGATAGHLDLFTSEVGSSVRILGSGESLAEFTDDGDVDLFHNGTLKMSTTATGISVAGSVVDNLTRGSIKVGNSSGVFAPLAKGAANTVLTSDGTDLSFVAASGGGEQTFTATGAISAGNPVGFNANMTISAMPQQVGTAVALGSGAGAEDRYPGCVPIAYDTALNKFLHVFYGTDNKIFARVGTVSGFGISFGTAVDSGRVAGYTNRGMLHLIYDDNAEKFVISYTKSNNKSYAATITISGTTPSFGTEIQVYVPGGDETDYQTEMQYDSNANKVLFISGGSQSGCFARTGTISGTNLTLGAVLSLGSTAVYPLPGSLTFDTNANKFIWVYRTGSANGTPSKVRVLTISGTSVTVGAEATLCTNTNYRVPFVIFDPSINKGVALYTVGYVAKFKLLTISGTSVVQGTETTIPIATQVSIGSDPYTFMTACVNPDTAGLILAYTTGANGCNITPAKFSGANMTLGAEIVVSKDQVEAGIVYDPDTDQPIVGTMSLTNSISDQVVSVINNGFRPAFVGVAAENISNGATGKVTIIGGINVSQSSLVVGSQYGIPTTSASLVATDTNPLGIAITASKIYIRASLVSV